MRIEDDNYLISEHNRKKFLYFALAKLSFVVYQWKSVNSG
jgi:hypothetical protein